jgi:hypothetical protein
MSNICFIVAGGNGKAPEAGYRAPLYADFIASFPVFASVDESLITFQLSLSTRLLSKSAWGDFYSDGVLLDTAHNLSIQQVSSTSLLGGFQAAAGPLSSTSAAGMSSSFATPDLNGKGASGEWYAKTIYGQQFLRLRNTVCSLGILAS